MNTSNGELGTRDSWCAKVGLTGGGAASPVSLRLEGGERPEWSVREFDSHPEHGRMVHGLGRRAEPAGDLELVTDYRLAADFAVVEWVPWLANEGEMVSPLVREWLSADVAVTGPGKGEKWLHYASGSSATVHDFAPHRLALRPGTRREFQPAGGRSSSGVLPYFNLATGDGGVVVAIGWSGQWWAEFACGADGDVVLRSGLERTRFRLGPGEKVRGPRVVLLFWEGADATRGHNMWRRWLLKTSRPAPGEAGPSAPFSAATWGETSAQVHGQIVDQIAAKRLPFENYWVDAGWFGPGPWRQSVGTWSPNPELWPGGIRPVTDRAHAAGMKMALWFEPERVAKGSIWAVEHPEWLLHVQGDNAVLSPPATDEPDRDVDWVLAEACRTELEPGDALINLAEPEVLAAVTDFISEKITRWGIDVYRHDFNFAPLQFWRDHDGPDRAGVTEMKYVAGLYAFFDALLARHPGLRIDNCASGGRRIDVEMMQRSVPLTRSDYFFDPVGHQSQTYGLSFWLPCHATIAHTGYSRYALLSATTSGLSLSWCNRFNEREYGPVGTDAENVRSVLRECISLRAYFLGDFYPLTGYTTSHRAWLAYQFHRPELGDGIAIAFRRPECEEETLGLALRGLEHSSVYRVDIDGHRQVVPGPQLAGGLVIKCEEQPGVRVIKYQRADRASGGDRE
jgi:alpha-galactosidase